MTRFIFTLPFFFALFLSSCGNKSTNIEIAKEEKNIVPDTLDLKILSSSATAFQSLFNGENLEGWEIKQTTEEKANNFWTIQDGTILLNSLGTPDHDYIWLQTKKEYGDFILKLKFQSHRESPGNSGVQIRSRYDETARVDEALGLGWLDGPQVDIHPSGAWRTGFIYDETRGQRRWIYPSLPDWKMDKETYAPKLVRHYFVDEPPYWNELIIACKGNRIKTVFNGLTVTEFDGTGVLDDEFHQKYGIDNKGHIALQLHKNDEVKIAFKDIEIKEL